MGKVRAAEAREIRSNPGLRLLRERLRLIFRRSNLHPGIKHIDMNFSRMGTTTCVLMVRRGMGTTRVMAGLDQMDCCTQ